MFGWSFNSQAAAIEMTFLGLVSFLSFWAS